MRDILSLRRKQWHDKLLDRYLMQLCLYGSIAWRHPRGFPQVIEWARQYGWDLVDARGMSLDIPGDLVRKTGAFGYDMLGPRQIRKSARMELRQKLADAGSPLLGIYCSSPVNLTGNLGDSCRLLFCEFLELAADLGARWVRAINNTCETYQGSVMTASEAFTRTVDGLRQVSRRANDLGVGLMFENNENTTSPDARSLKALKSDVGDACLTGIAYDPVNSYFSGDEPKSGLEILRGTITCLHLKNVRRHAAGGYQYLPKGDVSYEWTSLADGDLDWPGLLHQARQGGFQGPLVFEYVNPFKGMPASYWDSLREPHLAAQAEAQYLRHILDQLNASAE